jgi:hypothetical protein
MAQGKIKVRGVYRSGSHLPIWEVMEKARIWQRAGLELASFEYCAMPPDAERALFKGEIDSPLRAEYTFAVEIRGQVKVFINGTQVLDAADKLPAQH